MKVGAIAINLFAKQMVGGVPFEAAKGIVLDLQNRDMTNEEKRAAAVARLQELDYALAGFLVNLAVELAVAWVKEQSK
ncbi:hypothetical protein [Methylomicrobium sp. Wu6]|uniref:hypothetical protein n=1 Tax=Methylomicrobium sp. Wu6 TaxID=3107928 RepID=UPI002DD698C9|nr:hypothetical protein [Methylomicrobium sp. Wu6]MEC4750009.1 hypothetical protein [Methylomicrobium sp. Wu6]